MFFHVVPGNVSNVNHSVMISGENALIKITFQVSLLYSDEKFFESKFARTHYYPQYWYLQSADACAGYPVTHYNLSIVRSSDVNKSRMMLGPFMTAGLTGASRVEITLNSSDGILQNVRYHFLILTANIIGTSTSSGMEFCKDWNGCSHKLVDIHNFVILWHAQQNSLHT